MTGNPIVTLNRAVATAMVARAERRAGAARRPGRAPADHHRLHSVRAHLLEQAGDLDRALAHYRRAAARATNVAERRYRTRRWPGSPEGRWSVHDVRSQRRRSGSTSSATSRTGRCARRSSRRRRARRVHRRAATTGASSTRAGREPWPVRPEPTSGLPGARPRPRAASRRARSASGPTTTSATRSGSTRRCTPTSRDGRPALLLAHAVGDRDRRPRLRPSCWAPGDAPCPPGPARRGAALSRLARRRHLRRVGRLVRRRRLRQVRDQRRARGVAAARAPSTSCPPTPRCATPSSTSAGGSSTGCCGCRCRPGDRWPGWRSTACTARRGRRCRAGRTSTRPSASCTGRRPPPRCTWPRPPQRARGTSADRPRLRRAARRGRTVGVRRCPAAPRPPRPRRPRGHRRRALRRQRRRRRLLLGGRRAVAGHRATTRTSEVLAPPSTPSTRSTTRGFDFDHVSAPARLDLALHGGRLADHDRVVESLRARRRPAARPADPPTVGSAVRAGRRVGLGIERPDPEQPRRARRGPPGHRRPAGTATPSPPGSTTCSAATRSARATSPATARPQPPPAHPAVRPRPRPDDAAAPARRPRRRRELDARTRLPVRRPRSSGCRRSSATWTSPTSEVTNDVCIRWNAPLVWVAAFLASSSRAFILVRTSRAARSAPGGRGRP